MSTADLRARVRALSLEQKVRLLTGADFWSLHPEPAAGLRRVVVSDGPVGVRGEAFDERSTSANTPSPTSLAASWDVELAHRVGRLLAAEARRKGVDVLLAPTVNLHRTPYGGRHFECFSEDPLLTGEIGAAYVRGVQSGGVAATVKHFVANDSETDRMTVDARVDERALRELYLAPFEHIVREAGPWLVMAAYNRVNGTTMTEHAMIEEVLRGEWGFDGVVISDWFATRSTDESGSGGLDLAMPGPESPWGQQLVDAVRDGRVAESKVDDKVLNLLRLADRVCALDGAEPPAVDAERPEVVLRHAAAAGFVLARNDDDLLPLNTAEARRVAVLGPNAAAARTLGGGSASVFPPYTVSPLDGLRAKLGGDVEVVHARGVRSTELLAPASPELVTDPEAGEPGLAVRFLDADRAPIGTEHRNSGKLIWMGSFGPDVPVEAVGFVEVRGVLRATEAGAHRIGVAGAGHFTLAVDDRPLIDGVLELPGGPDPIEAMVRPPHRTAEVQLSAGQEVEVVLTHRVEADAIGTTFTLGLENPALPEEDELAHAVELAASADVAVLVLGTSDESESEGFDRDTLALPGRQDELVRRVIAANPRTVVVVNSGAPVLLPWAQEVPAVLLSWFPGQEFGNALADVLTGDAEPGGRLPVTWPAAEGEPLPSPLPEAGALDYAESIHIGHRAFERSGIEPAFWFGHGLGYTTWAYQGAEVPTAIATGEDLTARVRVRNSGLRPGREVVQVYLSREGEVERPAHWLAGFAAVDAEPGEEAEVAVRVPARAFQHHQDGAWRTETGSFTIHIGRSLADLPIEAEVKVTE
ncbi:beta-glucosidase H [Saccharopolyspora mangrovi]|uniref:Glycoside hydrolase family 3 C-terminal domain-containing protein n=1 Tax=Saccharopolyspora mangrovi TaxID=3082379 RepID=A0ABU6AKJ7_9PSEU|nr:glycoside hydrolase family 3 C-terminal domain-containing protein [Saccharopolyspora sp. S2-29]MEB3371835.1 glycoside hydrolase family 3 C-terminal domain-containing protein [Saccharopolyspora sp. S2-29]